MKMVDHLTILGCRPRDLREEGGRTLKEVADALGVSASVLQNWEMAMRFPKAEELVQLGGLYSVTVDWLLRMPGARRAL